MLNNMNKVVEEVKNLIIEIDGNTRCGRGFSIDTSESFEVKVNNSQEWNFIMEKDNETFQEYGYDNETQELLNTWKNNNLGDVIEVCMEVFSSRSKYPEGYVLRNQRSGEIFTQYIFSSMELDENTWFCNVG